MSEITGLSELIEEYIQARESRLELERRAEGIKKQETKLKEQITTVLTDANLTVGGGKFHKATLVPKNKPVADDWGLVYKYIKDTDSFDLLQKRFTETAVKARWDDNIVIPGIIRFPVWELSITKV